MIGLHNQYGFVKLITAKTLFINDHRFKTKFSPLKPYASPSLIYLARAASSRHIEETFISIISSLVSSTLLEGPEGHLQMLIAEDDVPLNCRAAEELLYVNYSSPLGHALREEPEHLPTGGWRKVDLHILL